MKRNSIQFLVTAIMCGVSIAGVMAKENVSGSGMIVNNNQTRELQSNCAPATAQSDLDINNVRARVLAGGDMWWDLQNGAYFVPKPAAGTRGPSSMFAASLWIGGYDAGGVLKVAAQTYRQTGNDFWPGPLNTVAATDASGCLAWDKHFIVNRADVEAYYSWFTSSPSGTYPIPNSILNWPAFADPNTNQPNSSGGTPMAPFYDYDGDGTYDPYAGDVPDFFLGQPSYNNNPCKASLYGDQAMFWVFNDKGNIHSETGGVPIGLEMKAQGFAFQTTDEINNMTFYKYTITNKSSFRLDSTFFGVWCDSDLGAYNDDYVGCDVGLGLGYSYNGDLIDGPSGQGELIYGANPPAVGIDFFEGPYADSNFVDDAKNSVPLSFLGYGDGVPDNERLGMGRFVYYNNDGNPVNGNPGGTDDYYQYLTSTWRNGQAISYGGNGTAAGTPCKYMFPGSSDQPNANSPGGFGTNGIIQAPWDEVSVGNVPADRRFLQSAGPFRLQPGAKNNITIGVVWARATQGGNTASLAVLKGADLKAQKLFNTCFKTLDGPTAPNLEIQELNQELILTWTNPSTSNNKNEAYSEFPDISDPTIAPYTFQGYMIYQLKDNTVSETDLYDVNKARLVYQCDIADNIKQIVNFTFDANITAPIPQEMVNGENKGITHSLKITEDKFATGNTTLVNHKTYYFAIIAYGYSPDLEIDWTNPLVDYKPFISGRKQADGYFVHNGIPHIPSPEAGGTEQHSIYGNGPSLKRIEGQGNGGNILDFTDETASRILSSPTHRVVDPVYVKGAGPVAIKVVDPLNVPEDNEFRFKLKAQFANTAPYSPTTASTWELYNITTNELVKSEKSILLPNEQIINGQPSGTTTNVIPKWGLSVNVQYTYDPGNASSIKNGFLEATMTFADPSKRWLTGLSDQEGEVNENWIRSGTVTGTGPAAAFNDFPNIDDNQEYEKILGGTWAPYLLCGYTTPPTAGQPIDYIGGPGWNVRSILPKMEKLPSIDVVITSDKSKWTRCPVLELQEEITLAIGGAKKLNRRKSPSVDKQGKKSGEPGYVAAEGDVSGSLSTPTGMGWFPGYALNLETGERLNMAFGEDSFYPQDNGADMIWNPTSTTSNARFGGKHYIYVFGHNGDAKFGSTDAQMPSGIKDIPRYDSAQAMVKIFNVAESTVSTADNYKREIFADAMWVNIPLLAPGHTLHETDVKIRLRVAKSYQKAYSSTIASGANPPIPDTTLTPINLNYPTYEFSSSEIETHKDDAETAKDALNIINIVPNPYYAYSEYELKTLDNVVKITNLPEKCKIAIYTLNGNLIRTFNKDDAKTSVDWDLKNHKRIPIASGLYIIHIEVPGVGEKILKWFGVMRPIDLESF